MPLSTKASSSISSAPLADQRLLGRARRLLASEGFRRHPARVVGRRLWWRLHWKLRRRTPLVVPFHGEAQLQLGPSSASLGVFLNDGFSDISVSSLFMNFLQPGMHVLDCGAHIGEYTVLFAQLVGAAGSVHAFEPDPRVFSLLEGNVERNRLSNVTLNNLALCDRLGVERLAFGADPTMSSLVRFSEDQDLDEAPTGTTTLDHYLEERGLTVIHAIKMDIEGAEAAALSGADRLLGDLRPGLVFVECDRHSNTPLVERLLGGHGYRVEVRRDRQHRHPHVVAWSAGR
jgi:FkbM family methyltransferase